jgi:hypothetical protein
MGHFLLTTFLGKRSVTDIYIGSRATRDSSQAPATGYYPGRRLFVFVTENQSFPRYFCVNIV